jgi:hypothetical protein
VDRIKGAKKCTTRTAFLMRSPMTIKTGDVRDISVIIVGWVLWNMCVNFALWASAERVLRLWSRRWEISSFIFNFLYLIHFFLLCFIFIFIFVCTIHFGVHLSPITKLLVLFDINHKLLISYQFTTTFLQYLPIYY